MAGDGLARVSFTEVGCGVGREKGFVEKFEGVFRLLGVGRKEVSRIGDVALGPVDLVKLGEVLDEVGVGGEVLLDLAYVDDDSTGEALPLGFDDGVRDVGGSH